MHAIQETRGFLRPVRLLPAILICLALAAILLCLSARAAPADVLAAPADGDKLLDKARLLWKEKEYSRAADTYRTLRDRYPKHSFVSGGHAQFWLWCSLGNAGRIAEEIVEIERFLKDFPDHNSCGYALFFLGEARRKSGDEAGAKRAFDELVKKYPDDPMAARVPGKNQAAGKGTTSRKTPRPLSPPRTLDVDFIDYAVMAANWLESIAEESPDGITWPEHEGEKDHALCFYSGTAGPCLFFLNMARLTDGTRYAALAEKSARFLKSRARPEKGGLCWSEEGAKRKHKASPGLYTGAAGIGHLFLCLHKEFGSGETLTLARGAADWIVASADREGKLCGWKENTDIISGAAGIGLFLLEMHAVTGDERYLECAVGAAEWLIARAVEDGAGLKWKSHASLDRYYTGFSHGTAGIAFYLARVFERTGTKRYLDHAEKGARWLKDCAVREGKGIKWFHYEPEALTHFQTGWCHGPAGTGRLFLELHRITGRGDYLKTAEKGAAWLMAHLEAGGGSAPFYGLSACCGAAGIGDFFLDLFMASGDEAYLEFAASVANALIDRARHTDGGCRWTNSERPDRSGKIYYGTSTMTGAAGVGSFFLKLHALLGNREHLFLPFADGTAYDAPQEEKRSYRNQPAGDYVVLTNLPKGDGYYKAASRLASRHRGRIVTFDPGRMNGARRKLSRLKPRYVAVVLKPCDIDANVQRSLLALSTRIDDDPFCDFAFGFVTGSTARDALALVDRSLRVEKKGPVKKIVSACVVSGVKSYTCNVTGEGLAKELGYEERSIYWSCVENDPEVLDFVRDHIGEIEGAGVVHLGGCGDPEGIWLFSDGRNRERSKHWPFDPAKVGHDPKGEMPRIMARAFRRLNLGSAVVWSGTCHSGVLHRAFVEGDIVSTFGTVDSVTEYFIPKGKSLALAILSAGAAAYMAPIGANHGYACEPECYRAMATGMPLGDVMRTRYNEIILAAGGKLDVFLFEPGAPPPPENAMRGGGVNRTLFGDPLFRPFESAGRDWLTVESGLLDGWGGFRVACKVTDTRSFMFWDMFGDDQENAEKIYTTAVLPEDFGPLGRVTAAARDPGGSVIETAPPRWAVERIDGRTVIHLQVNALRGAFKNVGTTAEFMVYPESWNKPEKRPDS